MSLVYSGWPWMPMIWFPYRNISTPVFSDHAITSAFGGSSRTYGSTLEGKKIINLNLETIDYRIFFLEKSTNLVTVALDDGKSGWDFQRREELWWRWWEMNGCNTNVPTGDGTACLSSQCTAKNLMIVKKSEHLGQRNHITLYESYGENIRVVQLVGNSENFTIFF